MPVPDRTIDEQADLLSGVIRELVIAAHVARSLPGARALTLAATIETQTDRLGEILPLVRRRAAAAATTTEAGAS